MTQYKEGDTIIREVLAGDGSGDVKYQAMVYRKQDRRVRGWLSASFVTELVWYHLQVDWAGYDHYQLDLASAPSLVRATDYELSKCGTREEAQGLIDRWIEQNRFDPIYSTIKAQGRYPE